MTAPRCKAGTRLGRMCRRANPQWIVVGDPYDDRFCRQHAEVKATRPGASGWIRNKTTSARVDVDGDGDRIPRNCVALVEALEAVRCRDGYERCRRAILAALGTYGSGVKSDRGLHPQLSAAINAAQQRLARIAATPTKSGVRP